jgi:NAD(P) transhydrogenase
MVQKRLRARAASTCAASSSRNVPEMGQALDIVVIGSGPAGQKAAIQAAKLRKRVAVVERGRTLGGVSVNTGTIPSKTIREAILYLTGLGQRGIYGQGYRLRDQIEAGELRERMLQVVEREQSVVRDQLLRNHVQIVRGTGRLLDGQTIEVVDEADGERRLTAPTVVIATGSAPARVPGIEFDGSTIVDSDTILDLARLPDSIVVVGAGVTGIEYASMFAALGSRVTVVDARSNLLDFCDPEIVEALRYHLRDLNVIFRFGETVTKVARFDGGTMTELASGKQIVSDAVFYSAGRIGATAGLGLEALGAQIDGRGRILVDERYRTGVGRVYAVGDVIGFPSLASTSAEQGRLAACDAFGIDTQPMDDLLPFGIYAIPEISFVGKTEPELTQAKVPYEVGIAHYRELARGQIMGETHGLLKLLVRSDDHKLVGVHAFGAQATEVIHIGQAVMGLEGTVDFLVETVFNYPTLAEAYKVAALDAVNKLRAVGAAASILT